jgi:hypothetical protein
MVKVEVTRQNRAVLSSRSLIPIMDLKSSRGIREYKLFFEFVSTIIPMVE